MQDIYIDKDKVDLTSLEEVQALLKQLIQLEQELLRKTCISTYLTSLNYDTR